MRHIVQYSGGVASWATAKRVVEQYGKENTTLLFADTCMEDEDLYRFLDESAKDVGAELVVLKDGRTPWDVFFAERFLGNSRVDPCSKILKRQLLDRWHQENCDPASSIIHLGYTWEEMHRLDRCIKRFMPFTVRAPLCEYPEVSKPQTLRWLEKAGIKAPRLYDMGFSHNNCGGFCIKAGQAHFVNLLRVMPERYRFHEDKEQELREYLGKDISILTEERYTVPRPLTLRTLRERVEMQSNMFDADDWGGCGCMEDPEDAA